MMVIYQKTICGGQDLTIKMAVWNSNISDKKKNNDEIEKEEMMNIVYFVW